MNDSLEFGTKIIEIELPGGARGLKGDTGSQGPQGDTGAKGDKGDKGDSGVWVGEDTPTEDYNVWVDPEGTESTVPTKLSQLEDDSTHRLVTDTEKTTWSGKQETLVSGTNIKTINNTSLLGSGNISINGVAGYDASWAFNENGTSTDFNNLRSAIENGNIIYYKGLSEEGGYEESWIEILGAVFESGDETLWIELTGNNHNRQITYDGTDIAYTHQNDLYLTTAQKVTSISSSSTNSGIPTAKAVYDYTQDKYGNPSEILTNKKLYNSYSQSYMNVYRKTLTNLNSSSLSDITVGGLQYKGMSHNISNFGTLFDIHVNGYFRTHPVYFNNQYVYFETADADKLILTDITVEYTKSS